MTEVALLAEFEVKPENLDRFLSAARRELKAVRANEPTCRTFEVILLNETEGRGVFVEIFENEAAAAAHRGFPHFTAFHDEITELDVRWSSRRGPVLATD
ncbi:MAG TPA: putative quinol monooxygenase [Acetobacteraceae bacterium]|jgi:autoinducer 2-degrading protein|nr:putative quinol monooxygenase [Acetobacteraceae bacterium]